LMIKSYLLLLRDWLLSRSVQARQLKTLRQV